MTDLRKALDNLEKVCPYFPGDQELLDESIKALRQALAQPEQRPVGTYEGVMEAMLSLRSGTFEQQQIYGHMKDKLLYTAPPKRELIGLTDEEILDCWKQAYEPGNREYVNPMNMARVVLAKAKEKNT